MLRALNQHLNIELKLITKQRAVAHKIARIIYHYAKTANIGWQFFALWQGTAYRT